jgi:hypothetical protein
MKLKIYNQENSKNVISGKALIRIARKSGLITFSKSACEKLGLTLNDKLNICQDEESPLDFYIHKTAHPSGFELRIKAPAKTGAAFNCAKLSNLILWDKNCKSAAYLIGDSFELEGLLYWPIITAKPIHVNRKESK